MKWLACLAIPLALCAFAQANRDAYRNAYKAWRQADPTLERDAGNQGSGFDQRAQTVAAAAAKYGAERAAFLQQLAADTGKTLSWLENAAPVEAPVVSPQNQVQYIAASSAAVNRIEAALAKDPDQGMRPLRLALEREHAALAAVSQALAQQQRAADAARDARAAAEQLRLKALEQLRQMVSGQRETLEQTGHETTAWADYYRELAAPPAVASSVPVAPTAVAVNPSPPMTSKQSPQKSAAPAAEVGRPPGPANSAPPAAEPAPSRPLAVSITPVPLVRYTGAWTYPSVNGIYHGPQPEFIDLTVRENKGHVDGSLSGYFKIPPGRTDDPAVLFTFSGDFKDTFTQVFDLRTMGGAKGTIQLIPGPAFNVLEVNFRIEPTPGKIQQGNFLVVKK